MDPSNAHFKVASHTHRKICFSSKLRRLESVGFLDSIYSPDILGLHTYSFLPKERSLQSHFSVITHVEIE